MACSQTCQYIFLSQLKQIDVALYTTHKTVFMHNNEPTDLETNKQRTYIPVLTQIKVNKNEK